MANTSVEFFPRHLFDNFSLKGAGAKGIFGFLLGFNSSYGPTSCVVYHTQVLHIDPSLALTSWRSVAASALDVERPTNATSLTCLQSLAHQFFRDIGPSAFAFGLSFASSFGTWTAFGIGRSGFWLVIVFAFVGIIRIGLRGQLGWATGS